MAHPKAFAHWTVQPKQGLESLQLHENVALPTLQDDECLVQVGAVSLNYRDVGIPNDNYPLASKPDLIPTSDAAGTVLAVGAAVQGLRVGDRVCTLFNPSHQSGERMRAAQRSHALGGIRDGVLRTHLVTAATAVIPAPARLSTREAATLPCAGVTAWNALFGLEGRWLRAGETVLVQGSGGVSLFALQFAVAAGATVIATTSSAAKADWLRRLGASHVINYREDPEWGSTAKGLTPDGEGVDHVIEVGGEATMTESLKAVRCEGVISIIGFLGGTGEKSRSGFGQVLSSLAIVRGVNVGSKKLFEEMNAFIDEHDIHPVLDSTAFDFAGAPRAFQYLWDAKHSGKVVIDVSGEVSSSSSLSSLSSSSS